MTVFYMTIRTDNKKANKEHPNKMKWKREQKWNQDLVYSLFKSLVNLYSGLSLTIMMP